MRRCDLPWARPTVITGDLWPARVATEVPCPDCGQGYLEQVPGSRLLTCPDCGTVRFHIPPTPGVAPTPAHPKEKHG